MRLTESIGDRGALWWFGDLTQAVRTVMNAVAPGLWLLAVTIAGRNCVLVSRRQDAALSFKDAVAAGLLANTAGRVQLAALHHCAPR